MKNEKSKNSNNNNNKPPILIRVGKFTHVMYMLVVWPSWNLGSSISEFEMVLKSSEFAELADCIE